MMQNNKKIAITGGIAGGKSTVAKIISEFGYTVISCDEIYKQLLQKEDFLNLISEAFEGVVTDGVLDRKKLSEIVFHNKEQLKKLNNITHPAIIEEAISRMQGDGMFFCEVPLLFECGLEKIFDEVIVVLRDKESRISEIVKRDNKKSSEAELIINSQFDYDNYKFEKYYVIHNNGSLNDLKLKISDLIEELKVK